MVTRGLMDPDKTHSFSRKMQWIFQSLRCFMNIPTLKMTTKCHEDGRQNTLSMVFTRDSARHHFQNIRFGKEMPLSSIFAFRGQHTHSSVSMQIEMLGWTQLWVGQAIHACLYTATNDILRNKLKDPMNEERINTYVTSCTWTLSKHINSRTNHTCTDISAYFASCTWTISKHINSCTNKHMHRVWTPVSLSCTWTIGKHRRSRTN